MYTNLADFLDQEEILQLLDKIDIVPTADSLPLVLILGVLSIGRFIVESHESADTAYAAQLFAQACNRMKPFIFGNSSLLKLQV